MAILLVLIWHYLASQLDPQSSPIASWLSDALSLTWSGVDLFFVLSGFLIGGILLDHRDTRHYFKAFYTRRICRIFPLYFVWLLLFVVIGLGATAFFPTDPLKSLLNEPVPLWWYATFTQNIAMALMGTMGAHWLGVTWSLAIEEQFYLVLPPLVRFLSLQRLLYVLVTLIVAAPILRAIFIYPPPHSAFPNYVLMPTRADSLLMGVLVAYMIRQEKIAKYLSDHLRTLYLGLGIFLGGAVILMFVRNPFVSWVLYTYGFSWLALLYSTLILIAMTEKKGAVKWLTTAPWLRKLGILAYGIYLIHTAIEYLTHALLLNQAPQVRTERDVLATMGALLVTLTLAYFSWNLFEKRMVALGHSVAYGNTETAILDPAFPDYGDESIRHRQLSDT